MRTSISGFAAIKQSYISIYPVFIVHQKFGVEQFCQKVIPVHCTQSWFVNEGIKKVGDANVKIANNVPLIDKTVAMEPIFLIFISVLAVLIVLAAVAANGNCNMTCLGR